MGKRTIVLFLVFLALVQGCFAAEIEITSNVKSVKANVVLEGNGRIGGNLFGKNVEIEVLSFKDTQNQKVLSIEESLYINGKTIKAGESFDQWGNRYAFFDVRETGEFNYRIEALIETDVKFPDLKDYDLEGEIIGIADFLEASENIESNSEAIRTLAFNNFSGNSWLQTTVDVTSWVHETVDYDLSYFPEIMSAVETLRERKGVCDEFAVLAAAILRAKGIPTKFVTGLSYNPKEGQGWRGHAWLESFNPETGWISIDPTFGEAGAINGTHILRGTFPDPAQANGVKAKAVQTASIEISEGPTTVTLESFENFSGIFSVEAENELMPENQWHALEINAKNLLNGTVIGWFSVSLPSDFSMQKKRQLLIFEEGEEKTVEWNIRANTQLAQNQYLETSYRIVGLEQDIERRLKVVPGNGLSKEASLRVTELIPIVEDSQLIIELTLENLGEEKAVAEIKIGESTETIEVEGFTSLTTQIITQAIENHDYHVSITGPGLLYETTITVQKGQPFTRQETWPIWQSDNGFLDEVSKALFSVESAVLVAAVMGVAFIVVLLKELLSR